jgi:ribosomal protein L24E
VGRSARYLIVMLAPAVAALAGLVVTAAPAAAGPRRCLAHSPTSVADYQGIADTRVAAFGVGDITSITALPGGRRFFALGDTAYYNLNANGSAGPFTGFGNNSAWVQSGPCFTLLDRDGPGPRSWVLPPQRDGSVYWPGASVVAGPRLYVFMLRLYLDRPFGTGLSAAVAVFDLPSVSLARIMPIPWTRTRGYGGAAVYDGGYIYVYASQGKNCAMCLSSDLYVARVPESRIGEPAAWRYRAGSAWVADPQAAVPVLLGAVSSINVQRYGNGFLLVTKPFSILGPEVEAWWAPNPEGPWQDLGTVYNVPTPPPSHIAGFVYKQAYTYNPVVVTGARLANGQLLSSYNVGSFSAAEAKRDGRMTGPRFFSVALPPAPSAPQRAVGTPGPSPWTPTFAVDRGGRVRTVDGGVGLDRSYTARAVGVARTPTGLGGWVVASDGAVFSFGDAKYYGSMARHRLARPVVGIAATPTGKGYWLVARDGGIFSFGDARFHGSTGGIRLNKPIVAMTATPTGRGYWFVASDGGVFTFGDAGFYGSTGSAPPFFPITGMAATPDGRGYWLVTLTGQVYAFGDANWAGNAPMPLAALVTGLVAAPGGYRIVDAAGNVFVRGPVARRERIPTASPFVGAG